MLSSSPVLAGGWMSEERLASVETSVAGLRSDVDGLRADVDGLRSDVDGLRGDMSLLRGDMDGMRRDFADFRGQILLFHEDTIDRIKALAPDFDPLCREFRAEDARLAESLDRRIVPLETFVRGVTRDQATPDAPEA